MQYQTEESIFNIFSNDIFTINDSKEIVWKNIENRFLDQAIFCPFFETSENRYHC